MRIAAATWLGDELLVLLVSPASPGTVAPRVREAGGERDVELASRALACDAIADGEAPRWLITLAPTGTRAAALVVISGGDGARAGTPVDLGPLLVSPAAFAAECAACLAPAARERATTFLAAAPAAHGRLPLREETAAGLAAVHALLRVGLPPARRPPSGSGIAAGLDEVLALDPYGFWLTGWLRASAPQDVRLVAVSPEGARQPLPAEAVTVTAPVQDGEDPGGEGGAATFRAFVELEHPSLHPEGWRLEFRTPEEEGCEDALLGEVTRDGARVAGFVLDQIRREPIDESAFESVVLPTLQRLRGGEHEAQPQDLLRFGTVPAGADISIVVAVARAERIEHQLAQFVRDPDVAQAEILFVVPRMAGSEELAVLLGELHLLYGLPFALLTLTRAARRARAHNLGAAAARGRVLALLGGDVLPDAPGWLAALRARLDGLAEVGVVCPKLLNEDDSIASAGEIYLPGRGSTRWVRTPLLAGMARSVPGAARAAAVQSAPDACMVLAAETFTGAQGFCELYLGGRDEAADLCLRLARGGLETWYEPVELYNLDRPYVPRTASPAGARFDDWLFERRWGAALRGEVDASEPALDA